jgi:FKBP-type peptidyl-prolyl cis-trans isomerase SlpA
MTERGINLNDRVTLHYRLTSGSEELVNTFGGAPETFQLGQGEIAPHLEYALKDLTVGTHTTLHLDPSQAFGERDEARVQTMPLTDLTTTEPIAINHMIQFQLPNDQTLHGVVLSMNETTATLDFNHPLAGCAVAFEVHILAIDDTHHD